MTDLTDFLSKPPVREVPCNVKKWLADQDEESRLAFKKAILNPEWSISMLNTGLHKFGLAVSDETLRRHRNQDCRTCGPF